MQRGDRYVLFPAVMGKFPWQRCDKRDKKRKEDAMPKKVTLEMKIAKREKYKEKIEKNRAEIQPTIDAYNALDAEIKAELAQLEQKKRSNNKVIRLEKTEMTTLSDCEIASCIN